LSVGKSHPKQPTLVAGQDVLARALKDFSFANMRKFTINLEQEDGGHTKIHADRQT